MNQEREWRGNGVWAVFLILLGLVFLLNNFGILPWSVWGVLWRFWPVLFVVWGLQVIFGRSRFSRLIIGIISLLIVLVLLLLVVSANNQQVNDWVKRYLPNWNATKVLQQGQQTESTDSIGGTEYSNITKRKVKIDIGLGKAQIDDQAEGVFANLSSKYSTSFGTPTLEHRANGQELEIELSQSGKFAHWLNGMMELRYKLSLGMPEILTDFDVEIGTGSAEMNLDVLKVGTTKIEVGTGSVEVDFAAASVPTSEIKLTVGTGSIKIRLPKEVGLSIDHQVGLGSFTIDDNKLKGDGEYKTSNYDTATVKATLKGEVGTGSITIERY